MRGAPSPSACFATEGGLFYGGGFAKLGIQLLGIVSVAAWVLATMFIIFTVIKKTIGLRVSEKEEIDGLDYHEHGLASAYAGFAINDPTYAELDVNENTDLGEDDITKASPEKVAAAVKVVKDARCPPGWIPACTRFPSSCSWPSLRP